VAVLFLLKATINKPADMSNKEFYNLWLQEAEAAAGAREAGILTGLWKVPGKPVIIGIADVESADVLDQAVLSLPFWSQGFAHIVDMEVTPLRTYESWHEHLQALVSQ
jgi:muconolactone delta-isomerase